MDTGSDGGRDGAGPISEWSSTIGIVTAVAGNILISFALNIQRYAHIRLHRDREHKLRELRSEWEGSTDNHRTPSSVDYGTVGSKCRDGQDRGVEAGHDADANGRRFVAGNNDVARAHDDHGGGSHPKSDRQQSGDSDLEQMQRSFLSGRTVTSLGKRVRRPGRKSYLRSPYWWTGLVLMIVGEAGNFLAYGFAPASIVSPLGVVALISNCVIAPFMLKEKFRARDFWGVLVAIGGAVTVVLSASTSETKIGPDQIWGMITTWEFELYVGLTVALILVLWWASMRHGQKTILIDVGLVGLFGGYTALSTKGVSSLLSYTLWHVITFPITYALVAILVFSAMMQIRYINRALQRFDSTQVIPTQFVLFTISVIIGSAVLYRDFESTTLQQALKFVGGCMLTFLGVYLITSGRGRAQDLDAEEADEEEIVGLLTSDGYHDQAGRHDNDDLIDHRKVGEADASANVGRMRSQSDHDDESEDDHDRMSTPRVGLSRATSIPSISDVSSLVKSRTGSPTPQLSQNPWVSHNEEAGDNATAGHPAAGPASTSTPSTPTPADDNLPSTKVLLRFPSAPGLAQASPSKSPQTPSESRNRSSPAKYATPRTPMRGSWGSRKPGSLSRTPLSMRFSPGPLVPTLSGGLSAVVADSLRRDDVTPGKRRWSSTNPKRKGKKPRAGSPSLDDDDDGDGHGETEPEYETDDSLVHSRDQGERQAQFGGQLKRPNLLPAPSLGSNSRANTQEVVPTLSSTERPEPNSDVDRVRSLSDTWSDGLGRLGTNARLLEREERPDTIHASPPHDT